MALFQDLVLAMEVNEGGGTHLSMVIRKKRKERPLRRPSQCCSSVFVHTEQTTTRTEQERMQEHSVCQCCKFEDSKHEKDLHLYIYGIFWTVNGLATFKDKKEK